MYKKTLLSMVVIVGLTACGGSSSKKAETPAPTATATPAPTATATPATTTATTTTATTYTKLTDLEYKTLNLTNHYSDGDVEFKYAFRDEYNSAGDVLIDYRSNDKAAGVCTEVPNSTVFTYLCLTGVDDGRMLAHALFIDDDGKIKGNSKYSKTGDNDELEEVFLADKADGPVTGTVTNTAETNNKLSKTIRSMSKVTNSIKNQTSKMSDTNIVVDIDGMLKSILKK